MLFTIRRLRRTKVSRRDQPKVSVISACKGVDADFQTNISALLGQDYCDYEVVFAVENQSDPAYPVIEDLISRHPERPCRLVVAGQTTHRGQKVHNQLAALEAVAPDSRIFAFIDADAHPPPQWLGHLVHRLKKPEVGVVTGYRWYIPTDRGVPGAVLAAMNAHVASTLGPHRWNLAWGGSMAIRREVFEDACVAEFWQGAITDDLTLTNAVHAKGLTVDFEPKCFVPSQADFTWTSLFEFARRQFLITRICRPGMFTFGLLGTLEFHLAFYWALIHGSVFLVLGRPKWALVGFGFAALTYAFNVAKGLMRSMAIRRVFPTRTVEITRGRWADTWVAPLTLGALLIGYLLALFGRRITWRGIRYRLAGPNRTEKED